MAKVLLGPTADGNNLSSVEAIMKSLPADQAEALLAHVRQDKNWAEKQAQPKVNTTEWFKNMLGRIE